MASDNDDFGLDGDLRHDASTNRKDKKVTDTISSDSVAQDQIKAFIERIERLEEEKSGIASDITEVYAEAKGNGFDTKVLRKVVSIRKQDHNERMEQEALLELYLTALGMAVLSDVENED